MPGAVVGLDTICIQSTILLELEGWFTAAVFHLPGHAL